MSITRSYLAPSSAVNRISLYSLAKLAIPIESKYKINICVSNNSHLPSRFVALRYSPIRSLYGNTDVVAPISAPMLQIVPIP
jgi:hypothetical protein